jgi:serine/threonine protein kinase
LLVTVFDTPVAEPVLDPSPTWKVWPLAINSYIWDHPYHYDISPCPVSTTHRDIKPENILIFSRNPLIARFADFGLSGDQKSLLSFSSRISYSTLPSAWPVTSRHPMGQVGTCQCRDGADSDVPKFFTIQSKTSAASPHNHFTSVSGKTFQGLTYLLSGSSIILSKTTFTMVSLSLRCFSHDCLSRCVDSASR